MYFSVISGKITNKPDAISLNIVLEQHLPVKFLVNFVETLLQSTLTKNIKERLNS